MIVYRARSIASTMRPLWLIYLPWARLQLGSSGIRTRTDVVEGMQRRDLVYGPGSSLATLAHSASMFYSSPIFIMLIALYRYLSLFAVSSIIACE